MSFGFSLAGLGVQTFTGLGRLG